MSVIQDRATFIRCKLTSEAKRSLFLSDLDTVSTRRSVRDKVPMYIPLGSEHIDIPFTDRVHQSYLSGSIRGFMNQGLLEAYILEAEGSQLNFIREDTGFVQLNTSAGPSTLVIPPNLPEGTSIIFKKVSADTNTSTIQAHGEDSIELGEQLITEEGAVLILKLTSQRIWRVINASGGGGGSNTMELVGLITADIEAAHNQCVFTLPPPGGLIVTLEDATLNPGGYIEVVKTDASNNPVFIVNLSPFFRPVTLTAPYETAAFRSLDSFSWVRIS